MKILIVTQRYWPENFRITDIAETLVKEGNDVTALTGLPNYPKGYVLDEYKHGKNRIQEHNGVHIIRAKEIGRRNNIFFRFLNYWSYQHYAKKLVNKLDKDFDVVLINELSPIMSANPGLKYAKKYNKKVVMYEMDLWPESLLAGGITHKSLIYKHYKKVSAKIYSKCDKILVSTKEHIEYIKALPNCGGLDIEYLPQYAESIFEDGDFTTIDNGVIDLMFAGNIGKAQSVDTIIRAASLLKDDPRFKFHIVGDGSELENVKKLAKELDAQNVIFYGQKSLSEMPELYKLADVMLVTLEDKPYANMTIPGKVQSYMAAGKPIVAAINGATANLIERANCGFVVPPNNYSLLAKHISSITNKQLNTFSNASKELYSSFTNKLFFSKLLDNLVRFSLKTNPPKDRPLFEYRFWGKYMVLDYQQQNDGTLFLSKRLTLDPGKSISYQKHHHRKEVWTILSGKGFLVLNGVVKEVKPGETIIVNTGDLHSIKAITTLCIHEVQTGDLLSEEDIERFPWNWQ